MAMATLTSVTSLTNNRDVSFSSYLSKKEETFVQKLGGGSNKNQEDGEIGIFSAEKYFSGGIDEDSPRLTNIIPRKYHQPKKDYQDPGKPNLVHPAISTPSIHSESSWNSQTALLQNVVQRKTSAISPGKSSNKNRIKTSTNSSSSKNFNFLAGLGCKYCSCSDKDSVDVVDDELVGEISFKKSPVNGSNLIQVQPKTIIKSTSLDDLNQHHQKSLSESGSQIGIKKENCFSFPTSNSNSVSGKFQIQKEGEVLKPRKSIEVFGSPVHDKKSKSFRIERRLSMLSWETTAPPQKMDEIEYSNIKGGGGIYNDNESDASSDLFEIESLTGKVTPFLARQGSDATSGCVTPTTCYAPSEASIEWSVVTASAADFSVISDFEELRPPTRIPSPIRTTKEIIPKRRPSILLGCNSHKSVRVAGDAYSRTSDRTNSDPRIMRGVSDSYMPVTRFPAETKLLMGFDARQRLPALTASHSLPRSQNSHLLYI